MALHPPYNPVKAIGAIASHQLGTIGVVALPHTSHTQDLEGVVDCQHLESQFHCRPREMASLT